MKKHIQTLVIGISAAAISACSGGGSSSLAGPSIDVTPANGAINVEPTTAVSATFPFDVLGISVDENSFSLNDGNTIASSTSFDGVDNIATLEPEARLGLLKSYTATLSTEITNLSGDPITQTQWSFTTRDGNWSVEEKLEELDTNATSEHSISLDDEGNAIAIWYTSPNIYASYYEAATGDWSAPEQIDLNGGADLTTGAAHPMVKMDNEGDAIAVWSHNESGVQQIYANHFDKTNGWLDTAIKLDAINAGIEFKPQLGIDAENDAIVVWFNQTEDSVHAVHYDKTGATWGNPVPLENSANPLVTPNITPPSLSVSDTGDAISVWTQNNGVEDVVYSASYDKLSDVWSAPVEISDANDAALDASVAMNISGQAIAIWEQAADGRDSIFVNQFDGTNWGTAQLLESNDTVSASHPNIAFENNGTAIAVWKQNGVIARRFLSGSGWEAPSTLGQLSEETIWYPQIVMDAQGNAISFWRERNNDIGIDDYVVVNRYNSANNTWEGNQELARDPAMGTYAEIAISTNGYAAALWLRKDLGETKTSLWTSVFE